ncbi:hypothetical protein J6590_086481 [Homalodisca vitripennis]|nr:hypothetical protein J6590_086481 [Homalodisca vitripennis]
MNHQILGGYPTTSLVYNPSRDLKTIYVRLKLVHHHLLEHKQYIKKDNQPRLVLTDPVSEPKRTTELLASLNKYVPDEKVNLRYKEMINPSRSTTITRGVVGKKRRWRESAQWVGSVSVIQWRSSKSSYKTTHVDHRGFVKYR